MLRILLNYPVISRLTALVIGVVIFYLNPVWLPDFYRKLSLSLPSALFSIMGFVIAATAIVISLNKSDSIENLSTEFPNLWKQLIRTFTNIAYVAGLFALFLIFVDNQIVIGLTNLIGRIIAAFALAFLVYIILQVITSLYALEQVAFASTIPKKDYPQRSQIKTPRSFQKDSE